MTGYEMVVTFRQTRAPWLWYSRATDGTRWVAGPRRLTERQAQRAARRLLTKVGA